MTHLEKEALYDIVREDIWDFITYCLSKEQSRRNNGAWTLNNEILCETEAAANNIANFLEDLGVSDYVRTGYYDPEEDEVPQADTGYYYIDID